MQGRERPEWQEGQEQGPNKHVSFHKSVKARAPRYDYTRPYRAAPPPHQPRVRGPPPEYGGPQWMYEAPTPPRSWQEEYYESPPSQHYRYPSREEQQRFSPLQPKRPYMPSMHSPEPRRPPPPPPQDYDQQVYRPPRIPYRRAPPEAFYPPSPKRLRVHPPSPATEESETAAKPDGSLSLLAKVASQGDSPNEGPPPPPPQPTTPSKGPPLHQRRVVPPSPATPAHRRTPSYQLVQMSESWPTHSPRRPPSPPHPLRREFYPPPPSAPSMIEHQPSWTMSPGSVALIERGPSYEAETPPGFHSGGAYPYGYFSPEAPPPPPPSAYDSPRYGGRPPPPPPPPPPPQSWREQAIYGPNHVSPSSSYEDAPRSAYHAPYTYVQQPRLEEKTILRKKFAWRHYPELERFLIANRDEYLRHSAMNYTAEQKQYNNWLTERVLEVAAKHNYEFDPEEFNFVAIRDRIRCYYKSYVQTARKRGVAVLHKSSISKGAKQEEEQQEQRQVVAGGEQEPTSSTEEGDQEGEQATKQHLGTGIH